MKRKSESPGPRYPALLQLLRTAENLWNASRTFFERWELSPSQFNVLNLLHGEPQGLSQIEISRQLIMHRSNVTGLIDRLEKRGLLQRLSLPGDRRAYRVVLTASGGDLLARILPDYYHLAEQVWGDLPVGRTAQLLADLSHLDSNLAKLEQTLAQ
jgi:MarR family 2-MHQ and catechol resistance regulon transcriptional repressor